MIKIYSKEHSNIIYVKTGNLQIGEPRRIHPIIYFFDVNGTKMELDLCGCACDITFDCDISRISSHREFKEGEVYDHAFIVKRKGDETYTLYIPSYLMKRFEIVKKTTSFTGMLYVTYTYARIGVKEVVAKGNLPIGYDQKDKSIEFMYCSGIDFTEEYKKADKLHKQIKKDVGYCSMSTNDLFKILQKYNITKKRVSK